jgi:hypothetical protein
MIRQLLTVITLAAFVACGGVKQPMTVRDAAIRADEAVADTLRSIERRRLAALVSGDTATAGLFHAPDFQLITPAGDVVTRSAYLGGIASGLLHYEVWQPDSLIRVRVYDRGAVLRYRSQLQVIVTQGGRVDTAKPYPTWHTDLYERRPQGWQVVWSQATHIGR